MFNIFYYTHKQICKDFAIVKFEFETILVNKVKGTLRAESLKM